MSSMEMPGSPDHKIYIKQNHKFQTFLLNLVKHFTDSEFKSHVIQKGRDSS